MSLELTGVTRAFGEVSILDGVDLRCDTGQAWAIVGANGAGKSTLMKIAAGLQPPSDGKITLDGEDVRAMDRRALARARAVVGAGWSSQLFDFTTLELVLMGEHANTSRWSLPDDAQIERARKVLEKLDLAHLTNRPATVLSSGELQRVMLARALVSRARWLMLDEPTANLDMRHQLQVLRIIKEHCEEGGSALVILHDLSLVEAYFDQVAILHEGKIAATGAPKEAMSEELLSEVFQVNMCAMELHHRRLWYATDAGDV
jgi:iron complex transport system ATP-binding protein